MKIVVFVVLVIIAVAQSTEKKRISRIKCEEYNDLAKKPACASGAYPFVGAIGYENEGEVTWGCSGTLISDQFVLTVAHCTNNILLGKFKYVRFGETDLSSPNSNAETNTYTISQDFRHPAYKRPSVYNDIALVKLDRPVTFTEHIRPACLSIAEDLPQYDVVGFSFRDKNRTEERKGLLLHEVNEVASKEKCNERFVQSRKLKDGVDYEKQFCTQDGSVSCEINSGGPLLHKDETLSCMQNIAGMTAIGSVGNCNGVSLNVKISGYVDWIESIVWA